MDTIEEGRVAGRDLVIPSEFIGTLFFAERIGVTMEINGQEDTDDWIVREKLRALQVKAAKSRKFADRIEYLEYTRP